MKEMDSILPGRSSRSSHPSKIEDIQLPTFRINPKSPPAVGAHFDSPDFPIFARSDLFAIGLHLAVFS